MINVTSGANVIPRKSDATRGRNVCIALVIASAALLSISGCAASSPGKPSSASDVSASNSAHPDPDSATPVAPQAVIVVAGVDVDGKNVTASGYISGVIQSGATCTFEFTGPGKPVQLEQQATADRLTTSCGTVSGPIDDFSRGAWTVTLQYPLKGKTITSQPSTVNVP
jgi:hypothetical protein